MTCPNCGAENINGSSFCVKCGTNLKEIQQSVNNVESTQIKNEQPVQQPIQSEQPMNNQQEQSIQQPIQNVQPMNNQQEQSVQQPVYNQPQNNYQQPINNQSSSNASNAPLNYLAYVIAILLKPFKSFKEEESKLCNTKTTLIFSCIVAGAMMLITLLKSMITVVFTKTMDYSTFKYKTNVDFSRLKDLNYLSLIGKNLLIFAGIILAIALVYYIVSLIFKKSTNFIKLLSISATSLIPYVLSGMIVSPLIGKIWNPLGTIFMVAGFVYSLIILYELMNDELKLEGDAKIYFNLICLGILGIAGYYVYMKLFMSSITGGLENLIDLFQ